MDNFWHRLMSKTHLFRLAIHTAKSTLKKKKKKTLFFFSLQVIFYIVWNFVMKIPSHHASSHCRQNDEFVLLHFYFIFFLLSQWNTHSLPNRTLPFFCNPIMILYCTYQKHLTCHNAMSQKQFKELTTGRI